MASINTENLEDFYKRFLKGQDKYAFFLGGVSTGTNYETSEGDRNIWENISLLSHTRKNDVKPVVRRISYKSKKSYDPWRSRGNLVSDNYYVLNTENDIVYLCLSSNSLNRSDLFNKNNSTVYPTSISGIQKTSDGYEWLPLYKVDSNSKKFLTDNIMPVNDAITDYDQFPTTISLDGVVSQVCHDSSGGISGGSTGACGLYPLTRQYNADTEEYINAGNLWHSLLCSCWRCHQFGELLGMDTRFMFGDGLDELPSSITLQSNLDKINASSENPLSNAKIQAALSSSIKDGQILSMFINLSSLKYAERVVSTANPEIIITSGTGSGATAKLITYQNSTGDYIVDGISIVTHGLGYYEYSITIPSITNASTFIDLIELNIEPPDGVGTSTRKLLNCNQLAFKFEIDSDEIVSAALNQKTFTTYGMLKNPITTDNSIFGSDLNTNEKLIKKTTTRLVLDIS